MCRGLDGMLCALEVTWSSQHALACYLHQSNVFCVQWSVDVGDASTLVSTGVVVSGVAMELDRRAEKKVRSSFVFSAVRSAERASGLLGTWRRAGTLTRGVDQKRRKRRAGSGAVEPATAWRCGASVSSLAMPCVDVGEAWECAVLER